MIAIFVIAAAVICVPIAAAALVTFASRREHSRRTIAGSAPCPVTAFARRVLSFQARGIEMPGHPRAPQQVRRPAWYGTEFADEPEPDEEMLALPTRR
jgi:hypothetical protein